MPVAHPLRRFALVAGSLVACGPSSPDPASPPAVVVPPASASAAIAPSASPSAAPSAVASAAPAAPAAPGSPFSIALTATGLIQVFPVKGGAFIAAGEGASLAVHRVDASGTKPVAASFFDGVKEPTLWKGGKPTFRVAELAGALDGDATMKLWWPGDDGGADYGFARKGDAKWTSVRAPAETKRYQAAHAGGGVTATLELPGGTLYESVDPDHKPGPIASLAFVSGKGVAPKLAGSKTKGCPTRVAYHRVLVRTASGELLGVGQECTGEDDVNPLQGGAKGALLVERWPSMTGASTVEALPGGATLATTDVRPQMVERGADVILWAAAAKPDRPYVARRSKGAWADVSPKITGDLSDGVATADGAVVLHAGDHLARLAPGASDWEDVGTAPRGGALTVGGDGTVWLAHKQELRRLAPGARAFEAVALPALEGKWSIFSLWGLESGETFVAVDGGPKWTLLRLAPKAAPAK